MTERQALQRVLGDGGTTAATQINQTLNDAYRALCEAYDWPWLKVRATVSLIAAYSTGTVTIVDDTTDYMTTTGTWSTSWSPVRVRTAGGHDYLLTYNAGNSRWEMDRNLEQAESGVAYTLYKDTYALAARLRSIILGWGTTQTDYPLDLVTADELQAMYPVLAPSTPVRYGALVEPDTTNLVSQLMVRPIPSSAQTIHYRGFKQVADLSADGDVLQFPASVLSLYRRLARSMAFEYRGNLERATDERAKYELELQRHIKAQDPTAHVQDEIRLDEHHFLPRGMLGGGYDYYGDDYL